MNIKTKHRNKIPAITNSIIPIFEILACIFLFGLAGCNLRGDDQRTKNILTAAEACMETQPDSALILLQSIKNPSSLRGRTQADYALLYTQAWDKNSLLHTSDSLIQIAVEYYGKKSKDIKATKSYFYLGSVYRDTNQDAKAINAFLKALEKMPSHMPNKLQMQIYFNLGECYYNQDLYDDAMNMYRNCLKATQMLNDPSLLFFPYRGIAAAFLSKEENDSALAYHQKALDISRLAQNSYWEALTLSNMSLVYLYKGDTIKAEQLITTSNKIDREGSNLYLKGKLLYLRNEADSARQYLLEACQSDNIYTKTSSYELLYEIEKKIQNHSMAYTYNDSFKIYRDSIETLHQYQEIQTLSTEYALKLQKKEMKDKEEERYWVIGFIITIFLSGGFSFYQYLRNKHKEELLRLEQLNFNDHTQIINYYLEEKLGEEISIRDTVRTFRKEKLQAGIRSFSTSPWKEKLEEAEKRITPGNYIKPADQELLYRALDTHFEEFITNLTTVYPEMSKDDIYYCILSCLKHRSRTLVYCMRTPAGTLRTRKSRLKKNMAEEMFQLIFNM